MCKKLIHLFPFVLVLSLVCNAWGQDGTGLQGEYFHWSGSSPPSREAAFHELILTRIDPEINVYWNPGISPPPSPQWPPPPGVRVDTFAVRWTGELEALSSEAYTFITGSDDGVRLYFNGELIIDNWTDHDRTENTSQPVQLVAGRRYPIVLEGYENGGEAEWQLYWQSQSTPRQVVPQRVLYPTVKPKYFWASKPIPADGALHSDTWVNLSWRAGDFAVSHDVYIGDNFEYVNAGAESTFQGNQAATSFIIGFPGFLYPDGLVPGTTYYWRIDEVNDADPNSSWKGDVWSFTVPPKTAYNPVPADGAELVATDVRLSWTAGFGAKLHTVYFGDNFDDVNNSAGGLPQGVTTYTPPGPLKMAKTYYWRVDEFDAVATYKGDVWSFTTQGAVGSPNPPNGAVDV
ncbi:MAG: PA14 domain-containing protein, partial [Phycisphaerae bacterium]